MAEPTIYEQADRYLVGEVSYGDLHRWVYDRIERYFQLRLDGSPDADLASTLVLLFAEGDLDREMFGCVDEEEFRKGLAAYLYMEHLKAQKRPDVAVSVSSQSS